MSKWSYSKVSTFNDCKLKYKYQYIENWLPSEEINNELAAKGLAVHQTYEWWKTGKDKDEAHKYLDEKAKELNVDQNKYHIHFAIDKFVEFWKNEIEPKEKDGMKISQESWANGSINKQPFCGVLDLLVSDDKKIYIYDYKTPKSINVKLYKNQLLLYAFMKGQERKWTLDDIEKNTELYVFFPLANEEIEDPLTGYKKSLRKISFTKEDIENFINNESEVIDTILSINWEHENEGSLSFSCSWCPYLGTVPEENGFNGCPISIKAGFYQKRGLTFNKKEK